MRQYSLQLSNRAGCLDEFARSISEAGLRIQHLACACAGQNVIATFSLQESEHEAAQLTSALEHLGARQAEAPLLHVQVPNRAGCLEQVVTPFSQAGARITSLHCACSAGSEFGTVSIGFQRE